MCGALVKTPAQGKKKNEKAKKKKKKKLMTLTV
jgi:hypothetical protein